eukprot:CAMPEP_0184752948 /NCGR_PEP_ID=MMETSP0315-20130426/43846_1 /TAXON_ID=101924 /ORGANISM="Rhodosorus marinus, Strain UTEX LB 2760" /LENGTH=390 /DNA_ID=CAMNT_0027232305 /DNA_START=521 /DNA_END=1693 /DNA_ORIENTATION=-
MGFVVCGWLTTVHRGLSRQRAAAGRSRYTVPCVEAPAGSDVSIARQRGSDGSDGSEGLKDEDFAVVLEEYVRGKNPSNLLSRLSSDCRWKSPLGVFDGSAEIEEKLRSSLDWLLYSSFCVMKSNPDKRSFDWVASTSMPYPHRPRVVVAGSSTYKLDRDGKVTEIEDDWFLRPREAALQIIPRWEDIFWYYGSPHTEINYGLRRKISESQDYYIVEESAHEIVEATVDFEKENILDIGDYFPVPRPPESCYTGSTRKEELYWPTRPSCVRRSEDGNLIWSVLYPTVFWGLPRPKKMPESMRLVHVPKRRLAVRKVYGAREMDGIEDEINLLVSALDKDGLVDGQPPLDSVLYFHYNSKQGFDANGNLSISSFYLVPFQRFHQEIAVVLPS